MRVRIIAAGLMAAFALVDARAHGAPGRVSSVVVTGTRVHLGDLVSGLQDDLSGVDFGPTPASTGTRFISREDVVSALREHGADASVSLPDGFRVRRQLRVLRAAEVTRMVTDALQGKLPRGTTLAEIKAPESVRVPDGWTDVRCDLPRPPHRIRRCRRPSRSR